MFNIFLVCREGWDQHTQQVWEIALRLNYRGMNASWFCAPFEGKYGILFRKFFCHVWHYTLGQYNGSQDAIHVLWNNLTRSPKKMNVTHSLKF